MEDYIQQRTENNAGLIYKADFYPIYTYWVGKWLSAEEMIILSFIYYWTKNWNYIYATNEDLTELAGVKPRTIRKLLKRLADLWYIEVVSKTIVWMGTDRKMKYIWFIDGVAKNASPTELASEAESNEEEKSSTPKKPSKKAKSTGVAKNASPMSPGVAKNASPWTENKFQESTCDYEEKSQNFGISPEVQNLPPYKNIYKKNILFTDVLSEQSATPPTANSTELSNEFMFDDGSIEYYTQLTLQQSSLEWVTNVLRKLFPHVRWYKWAKKDVTKALKQHTLDYDFVYGLIYDMKLLWFMCEFSLVRRPGFMSQWIDTYIPSTEKQRDEDLKKIVMYIKRNNQDKSLFETRVKDVVKLCGLEKYRKIFRSIPANAEDRVDLSHIK